MPAERRLSTRWTFFLRRSARLSTAHDDAEVLAQRLRVFLLARQLALAAPFAVRGDEAQLAERHAPFGCQTRADAPLREMRLGRGLLVMAHLFVVGVDARRQSEAVLRDPFTALVPLQQSQAVAFPFDAEGARALRLHAALVQTKRLDERFAEADVGQPALFELDEQRHVVELRPELSGASPDPGREHLDLEPECAEQR